jgi:AbrB family looped-hinge helix DNA binding protein
MKTLETVITRRGQVSVPAAVRSKMRLRPGQRVVWQPVSEQECRMLVAEAKTPAGPLAMLGYARTFRETRRTSEWLRELRQGEES